MAGNRSYRLRKMASRKKERMKVARKEWFYCFSESDKKMLCSWFLVGKGISDPITTPREHHLDQTHPSGCICIRRRGQQLHCGKLLDWDRQLSELPDKRESGWTWGVHAQKPCDGKQAYKITIRRWRCKHCTGPSWRCQTFCSGFADICWGW